MHILLDPFTFSFMQRGLLAVILVGIACATLGTYVVLRQMAFIGDALAHTAMPGLVVAYIYGWSLFLGALVADLVTALGIGALSRRRDVREDTAIGILFTGMFALGIVIMSSTRSFRDLDEMLFGYVLAVTTTDLRLMAAVTVLVLVTLMLLHKEMELTSFDPGYAQVIGIKAAILRLVLLVLLALTIVSCIQVVGVVLTSGLLITPAATASLVTRRLRGMMALAVLVALAAGVGGLYASYYFNFAAGASIVVLCSILFTLVYIWKTLADRWVRPSRT